MMMNFMVYGVGMFAYLVSVLPLQMGGAGAIAQPRRDASPLNTEYTIHLFGKDFGLFGKTGYLLAPDTYDVGVMVIFLFQMVFMDTTTTIVTGTVCERWKYIAFCVSSIFLGAFTYPIFRPLGVGRRLAGYARVRTSDWARLRRLCRLGSRAFGRWR